MLQRELTPIGQYFLMILHRLAYKVTKNKADTQIHLSKKIENIDFLWFCIAKLVGLKKWI